MRTRGDPTPAITRPAQALRHEACQDPGAADRAHPLLPVGRKTEARAQSTRRERAVEAEGLWSVAPDAGRPEGRTCTHIRAVERPSERPGDACEDCRALGWSWVRLRWCTTCGHIGCCDSSRGRHAYSHHAATGHPVALSLDPVEKWGWCYVDELFLVEAPQT
ncbi:UBP-type zinc finger domain-containing protein [Streptomyces sp. NPDC056543]|uniref:UBP-type zinc finger domain-containing protein n=1 Tax=unclassified Streptomyces TaxID=2593676 RepID=UPI0036775B4F